MHTRIDLHTSRHTGRSDWPLSLAEITGRFLTTSSMLHRPLYVLSSPSLAPLSTRTHPLLLWLSPVEPWPPSLKYLWPRGEEILSRLWAWNLLSTSFPLPSSQTVHTPAKVIKIIGGKISLLSATMNVSKVWWSRCLSGGPALCLSNGVSVTARLKMKRLTQVRSRRWIFDKRNNAVMNSVDERAINSNQLFVLLCGV